LTIAKLAIDRLWRPRGLCWATDGFGQVAPEDVEGFNRGEPGDGADYVDATIEVNDCGAGRALGDWPLTSRTRTYRYLRQDGRHRRKIRNRAAFPLERCIWGLCPRMG